MSARRPLARLAVAVALAHAVPAQAFGANDQECRDLLLNVENNLPGSVPSDLDGDRLNTARGFLERAKACVQNPLLALSPNKGALEEGLREMTAKVESAAQTQEARKARAALVAEGEQLAQRLRKGDGGAADQAAVDAWRAKVDAATKKNAGLSRASLAGVESQLVDALGQGSKSAAKGAEQARLQALVDGAVVKKLTGFTPEDSLAQKKIQEAFAQLEPASLVVTSDATALYDPAGVRGGATGESADKPHKRGMWMHWERDLSLKKALDRRPAAPAGTPGFVWSALNDREVIFVALDGGRYRVNVASLAVLTGPPAVPKALLDDSLAANEVAALVDKGVLPAAARSDMKKAEDAAVACAKKVWASVEKEKAAINVANITASTRENRLAAVNDRTWKKMYATCDGKLAAAEAAWRKSADARAKEREATLKAAAKRFGG